MKKLLALLLSAVLMLGLLSGCRSTQVQSEPETGESRPAEDTQNEETPNKEETPNNESAGDQTENDSQEEPTAGAVKTGLAVLANRNGTQAAGEAAGLAKYDITMAAVTVDDAGVIQDCVIDSVDASLEFDQNGAITSDLTTAPQTKNELGADYGMKEQAGSAYEWNEQAAALAKYAVGKTVEELRTGAVDENGMAADEDLASVATINLGGYVDAIEKAVKNATHLGAQTGDKLRLAAVNSWDKSTNATEEAEGLAQLDVTMTALTLKDDVITSCVIDGLQAKVAFDRSGALVTDLNENLQTKNELGEAYGMKEHGGSKYEWNEQAAFFAQYVTGKTAEEVSGIAVDEAGVPTEEDLTSTVTIKVGSFMELIEKAAR